MTMIRTSERGDFARCRWLWERRYVDRRSPRQIAKPLWFGTLIHAALANYYRPGVERGADPAGAFHTYWEEALHFSGPEVDEESWADGLDLGVAMLKNYIAHYGSDEEWEVLLTEQPFQTLVKHPRTGKLLFTYVGVIDGLWRHRPTGKLWIPDHKTVASIDVRMASHNEQATAYWTWGADWLVEQGFIKSPDELAGMLFNFLRKQRPDERPSNELGQRLNKDGSVSKNQPAPYFHRELTFRGEADRRSARSRAYWQHREMLAIRAGRQKPLKSISEWNCRGCSARDICELHEQGADWREMYAATWEPWDPYAEHEIYNGR